MYLTDSSHGTDGGSMETSGSEDKGGIGRRQFIGAAAAALFAGIVIQITGCDDGNSTSDQGGSGDVSATIGSNHPAPHRAVVTKAMLDAGNAVDLDIQGSADHSHTVSLNAAEMADIKAGKMVMKDSSS